ncbi:MAG: ABC transporter permease [Deltaproteobacteria bacterium]|nr:ABC transporter permease [Deltaproteobacteria bacterium]
MKFFFAVLRKIGYALLLLVAVLVLNFMLIHIAPGDPVDTLVGEMGGASPELIAKLRADYGLDRSLPEQLFTYIVNVAKGNLGMSFTYDQPVISLILDRLPATLLLVLSALVMAVLLGTFLGVVAAQKPRSPFSHFVTILSLAGYSAPVFWTGMMLLILLSYWVPLFPSFGMSDVGARESSMAYALDVLRHLILPAVTLASIYLAVYSRLARASMMDVLGSDYIRTARSKGLSERVVVYKHALKNALLPVVTMAGLQFSQLIAGAVVVETVFSWPGMGQLAFESILRRDHTLLLGILFFSTVIVVVVNLLTDLTYRLLDPRIK